VIKINVILFERDPGEWVAQCLEYDIGAQAGSLPDLVYELQRSLVGHIAVSREHGLEPFACLGSAPSYYWEKWQQEKYIAVSPPTVPFRIPGTSLPQVDPAYVVTP
jgi:hypothetical protein